MHSIKNKCITFCLKISSIALLIKKVPFTESPLYKLLKKCMLDRNEKKGVG